MSPQSRSLVKAISTAGLAAIVLLVTVRELAHEQSSRRTPIVELSESTTFFSLRHGPENTPCWGSFKTTVTNAPEEKGVDISGWTSITIRGTPLFPEFSGSLRFNGFNQLFGALITVPSSTSELRIGLLEIDPITVKVVNAAPAAHGPTVLFEQRVPGPIELVKIGNNLAITVPGFKWIPHTQGATLPMGIRVDRTDTEECTRAVSQPLDMTTLVTLGEQFLSKAGNST